MHFPERENFRIGALKKKAFAILYLKVFHIYTVCFIMFERNFYYVFFNLFNVFSFL